MTAARVLRVFAGFIFRRLQRWRPRVILETQLTLDQSVHVLLASVAKANQSFPKEPLVGKVTGHEFVVRKKIRYSNSFQPFMEGRFEAGENGTLIIYRIGMPVVFIVILGAVSLGLGQLAIHDFFTTWVSWLRDPGGQPLLIMFFGAPATKFWGVIGLLVALRRWSFLREKRYLRKAITALLDARPWSPTRPSPEPASKTPS